MEAEHRIEPTPRVTKEWKTSTLIPRPRPGPKEYLIGTLCMVPIYGIANSNLLASKACHL